MNRKKKFSRMRLKLVDFLLFFYAITSHDSHGTRLISWTWKKNFSSLTQHQPHSFRSSVTTTHTINLFFAERGSQWDEGEEKCALLAYRYQHRYKFTAIATMSIFYISLQLRNDFINGQSRLFINSIRVCCFFLFFDEKSFHFYFTKRQFKNMFFWL